MAAVLAAGDGAVLASLSAAALWRSWRRPVRTIHVLVAILKSIEGLRMPEVNTMVAGFEVDFAWPNLVVEVDGPGHLRQRTRAEDRRRDAAIKRAGLPVLRVSHEDL